MSTPNEIMDMVKALATNLEGKSELSTKNYNEITTKLAKFEEANQKLVAEKQANDAAFIELKGKYDVIEKILAKPGAGNGDKDEVHKQEIKSLEKWLQLGSENLSVEQKNFLRSDVDTAGGIFVPVQQDTDIIKAITEVSPMRSVAKVSTINTKRKTKPVRTTLLDVTVNGQAMTIPNSKSAYDLAAINVHNLGVIVDITTDELEDATIDFEGEILRDVLERVAQLEGMLMVKGDGNNTIQGFMASGIISQEQVSGSGSAITFEGVLRLAGKVKVGYNPIYAMNNKTLVELRCQKDSTGQFLWQPGNMQAGIPNTIGGYSYAIMPDLDDIAANAYPVVFGDFKKAYEIVDRRGLTVTRDPYSLASSQKVRFVFTKRTGGGVILKEALAKLKIST